MKNLKYILWGIIILIIPILQILMVILSSIIFNLIINFLDINYLILNYLFIVVIVIIEDISRSLVLLFSEIRDKFLIAYLIFSSLVFSFIESIKLFRGLYENYFQSLYEIYFVLILFFVIKFLFHFFMTKCLIFSIFKKKWKYIMMFVVFHIIIDIIALMLQDYFGIVRLSVFIMVFIGISSVIFLFNACKNLELQFTKRTN